TPHQGRCQRSICYPKKSSRKRKRTSKVLEFFDDQREKGGNVTCKYCPEETPTIYGPNTSTGTMKRHLKKKHPGLLPRKGNVFDATHANFLLAKFFGATGVSTKLVDNQEFRDLIMYLESSYQPPHRTSLQNNGLSQLAALIT